MPPRSGTVYLTAADASGMMVSYIQSNYMGFGSGVVVPGTGISLQNRGACFRLTPGHPNQVGPGKRPMHTIIPAFATRAGQPLMSFGVMGGDMQPQGHTQMMVRLADYRQNPQAAADGPRWKVLGGRSVIVEHHMPDATRERAGTPGARDPPRRALEHGVRQRAADLTAWTVATSRRPSRGATVRRWGSRANSQD